MMLAVIMVISLLPLSTLAETEEVKISVPAVSVGAGHSAAIKTDGSLWIWGCNVHGELGDGTKDNKSEPIKIMDNVVQVSLGECHSAAVKKDGTLWMWGLNSSGQLGNSTLDNSIIPIKVLDNVKWVSLGGFHSAAIKNDGSLWVWGSNQFGQLGDGTTENRTSPVKIMDDVVQVALGYYNGVSVKKDGTLWILGENNYGVPTKVMDNVRFVQSNGRNAAIKTDDSLWVWGNNDQGELGDGTRIDKTEPIKIMDDVAYVDLGLYHSAAVKKDGTLWTWGFNDKGQLGNKAMSNTSITIPTKVADDIIQVALGDKHSAAIKKDGTLWTWGLNQYGQLGNGTHYNTSIMTRIMNLNAGLIIEGESSVHNAKEITLKATRYDEDGNVAPEGGITWSCSDESVAQITPWGNNVTVKGLKGGKVTITATHAESGMSATHEIEVYGDMNISINAMQNADGIKTKYIDAMRDEVLGISVSNIPEGVEPEIDVTFDQPDFLEVGELKEVPSIQTNNGITKSYELPIKGIQRGTVTVTASIKGEQDKSDTAQIEIRAPRVFNNNVELDFGKVLPFIENERMFVGADKFFGLIGGNAQEQEKTVVATHNDTRFIYNEGQDFVAVNDTGATVKNTPVNQSTGEGDKLYVPLRFTAENYNGYVQWNRDERAAYITDDYRSEYISKVKKYCFNYPQSEMPLYHEQQEAYDKLIDNEKYLSYWFMKEYSEIDTSSLSAFRDDLAKKTIINTTALVFNDEMWTRLWNYLKAVHTDPSMLTDGIDEVEKEKYKDALKAYIESTHEKRTADKIVEVIDNITDPLKSAKSSISAATSPIKLDLKIEASADDLRETRKILTDLGVSSDLSDVSDYAKHVDNLLDEFDALSAVGTVSDIAGWGFILTDGLSDMMKTLGNYNTMNEYVAELDSMTNDTSLPTSLREAAKELKTEIGGNIDDAIRAPLKRMFDTAGEELTSDGLKTIASGTGATIAAQIFAGISIAKFVGNVTAGVDDVIKNISYVQMWGFLQESEAKKLESLATEFNKLYKAEKDIDEVYAAAEKVEESYKRLHNYRLQGETTYRFLQSGEYAIIDLQKFTGSEENVEAADNKIKMLNEISFR